MPPLAPAADEAAHTRELHAFVLELGRALSLAGAAVSETQERLTRIAAANGADDARIVVLPTALMIAFGRAGWATIEAIPQMTGALRLDQISDLYELVKAAERGEVEPAEGLRRMRAIRAMQPRHGRLVTILGYVVMTVGLCLVLQPTLADVAVAAFFGGLVGCLVLLARGRQTLTVLVPIVSAIVVSALTFELVKHGVADPGLRTLIAPLVTFLPGGVLTTATVELASGEMVAVSGFFGALAMTPVALAVARRPSGPPSQVTFLPAFWLLVPGALGLIGVTEVIGNPASAGLQDLVTPLASVISIGLGVLCGVSIFNGAAAAPSRWLRRPAA